MFLGYSLAKAHMPIRQHIWSLVHPLPVWKICGAGATGRRFENKTRQSGSEGREESILSFLLIYSFLFGLCIYAFV